ncbi:MAG: hypothetical protein C0429_11325 [Sphingopyxis sp.]|nr:hypothetical protein [Sphingopyxis sp.]
MSRTKCDIKLDTLTTLSPTQLHDQWKVLSGEDLPNLPASRIKHLIAYRLQEKQKGKLPLQIERQLDRIAASRMRGGQADHDVNGPVNERRASIVHGTRFVREWNRKTISVTKNEQGFDWNGSTYRSLSEIARKVTGAHWSGPRFFGLKRGQG